MEINMLFYQERFSSMHGSLPNYNAKLDVSYTKWHQIMIILRVKSYNIRKTLIRDQLWLL